MLVRRGPDAFLRIGRAQAWRARPRIVRLRRRGPGELGPGLASRRYPAAIQIPAYGCAKENLDRRLDPAQLSLTSSAAAAAWMEGWSMPLEKAFEYALAGETE